MNKTGYFGEKRIANYYYGWQPFVNENRYVGGWLVVFPPRCHQLPEVNGGRKDNLWPTLKGLLEP